MAGEISIFILAAPVIDSGASSSYRLQRRKEIKKYCGERFFVLGAISAHPQLTGSLRVRS
jgi:hypothetical protein